ncbi:hypothetical protein D3C84_610460 [compost metagenome]
MGRGLLSGGVHRDGHAVHAGHEGVHVVERLTFCRVHRSVVDVVGRALEVGVEAALDGIGGRHGRFLWAGHIHDVSGGYAVGGSA